MSRAWGVVRFKSDGKLMYYLYDGTSDICNPNLCDSMDDVWQDHKWSKCNCYQDEPVEIYSDYGGGFYWNGKACRHCNVITKGLEPWTDDEDEVISITDGQPDWLGEVFNDNNE